MYIIQTYTSLYPLSLSLLLCPLWSTLSPLSGYTSRRISRHTSPTRSHSHYAATVKSFWYIH